MNMHIDDFISEKIRVSLEKLDILKEEKLCDIEMEYFECDYKDDFHVPGDNAPWRKYESEAPLDCREKHYWFRFTVDPIADIPGKEPILCAKTGREGQWDATNPQGLLYINGKNLQGLDTNHTWYPLPTGEKLEICIYFYGGMIPGKVHLSTYLSMRDKAAYQLYHDILVPYECMKELDLNSYDYIQIRDELDKALMLIDFRKAGSAEYNESLVKTSEYLKENLYERLAQPQAPTVSCIGHTHIDVAWKWTVAQTKEKAERSFSTVLSLMERYPEYKFMTSQPQLLQFIKDNNPPMYEDIKKRVKEGRFELEGAMWLEADCNLASGESLVRQILHGKRFLRKEFGVESSILWLPDVFGYSAALPQILRKSGVDKFFTTKLYWSESNNIPNDTFLWQGIDGSEVLAHLIPTYVMRLNAREMKNEWQHYKNKSLSKNVIATVGFGDGGGGTTAEMLEFGRRLQKGLPGMPKVEFKRAGEFFDELEKDFEKNTSLLKNTPKWAGELYLEMHRGTYTSIAKNKKNNRKSELLYQTAEALSVADMLLLGGSYPSETFDRHWKTILLNQFHDILPGSSIKEVYDVTDAEYAEILADGNRITDEKLRALADNVNAKKGILVYNPAPFAASNIIELNGKRYKAENIPSHGYKVIEAGEFVSKVKVGERTLENDVIRVTLDEKYQLSSVYDKKAEREILASGAVGNRLEIYEDIPRDYDAWELTSYYKQKMWICDDVESAEKLENGFRITRKYGDSRILQNITLRDGSSRIDFETEVDWKEDHVLLKAAFPLDIRAQNATYDIQFGNIERPTHKNTSWDAAKFEVCGHKWADLSEHGYGVSILNDCKYGYSCEENILSISLLKAASDPYAEADRHLHSFTYSLFPHVGDFREGEVIKESYLLNMPLCTCPVTEKEGVLPTEFSIASCDSAGVVLETVKKAEDDDSIIVRLHDTFNMKSKVNIEMGFDFREVQLCDLMEENGITVPHNGRCVSLPVGNFEIITLKFIK